MFPSQTFSSQLFIAQNISLSVVPHLKHFPFNYSSLTITLSIVSYSKHSSFHCSLLKTFSFPLSPTLNITLSVVAPTVNVYNLKAALAPRRSSSSPYCWVRSTGFESGNWYTDSFTATYQLQLTWHRCNLNVLLQQPLLQNRKLLTPQYEYFPACSGTACQSFKRDR